MNALAPLITHSPSTSSARVLVAPASEPASGSVSPNAASAAAGDEVGQPVLLLLVGAERQDRVDAEADAGPRVMPIDWSTRPSSSIATQSEVKSAPRAAVLLRDGEAEQAELAHLGTRSTGKWCSRSHCATCGATSALGEVAHDLAESLVLLGQLEHHRLHGSPSRAA